jgi:hypothetical protein
VREARAQDAGPGQAEAGAAAGGELGGAWRGLAELVAYLVRQDLREPIFVDRDSLALQLQLLLEHRDLILLLGHRRLWAGSGSVSDH